MLPCRPTSQSAANHILLLYTYYESFSLIPTNTTHTPSVIKTASHNTFKQNDRWMIVTCKLWCSISTETIKLIRDGEGGGGMEGGKKEIIYLLLHCHHQNDSCIRMGSDESYINVSWIVRDKVTRQRKECRSESSRGTSAYQRNALLLGQIGSVLNECFKCLCFILRRAAAQVVFAVTCLCL